MPFYRPTLQELIDRALADIQTRLPDAETLLPRGNLQVLARIMAGLDHGIYGNQEFLSKQVLPDTASDEYLERHASIWGITRKSAAKATGQATVTGTSGTVIASGTVLKRADDVRYVSTAAATLAAGTATLEIEAETAGSEANAEAGVLLSLVTPLSGVDTVGQAASGGLGGGADQETDAELLSRLLRRIRKTPQGGSQADYVTWALEAEGITRAYAYPNRTGVGTVGVAILTDNSPTGPIPAQADVDAVQAYIDERRPVTASVTVFAPVAAPLDFEISLSPDTSAVRAAVAAELADLILREAEPEGGILLSHISEAISIAAGENDHSLTSPAADVTTEAGEIITMGTFTWS